MTRYYARTCPECSYYLGYSMARPLSKTGEISVTSFCLNCNYKLPIHSVVQGGRRSASAFHRKWMRTVKIEPTVNIAKPGMPRNQTRAESANRWIQPAHYSWHLRAIGQQLEKIQVATFNLECTGNSYVVWLRAEDACPEKSWPPQLLCRRLPQWLHIKNQSRISKQGDQHSSLGIPSPSIEFSLNDLEPLAKLGKNQRLQTGGFTNGHSLSQLLRTLGDWVNHRNYHLLGISWRDLSICIVVETGRGKREIDVFRPDNLYDLWVRMYLKRGNRALSDIPH